MTSPEQIRELRRLVEAAPEDLFGNHRATSTEAAVAFYIAARTALSTLLDEHEAMAARIRGLEGEVARLDDRCSEYRQKVSNWIGKLEAADSALAAARAEMRERCAKVVEQEPAFRDKENAASWNAPFNSRPTSREEYAGAIRALPDAPAGRN